LPCLLSLARIPKPAAAAANSPSASVSPLGFLGYRVPSSPLAPHHHGRGGPGSAVRHHGEGGPVAAVRRRSGGDGYAAARVIQLLDEEGGALPAPGGGEGRDVRLWRHSIRL